MKNSMFIEQTSEAPNDGDGGKNFDDDGRIKRTGWYYEPLYLLYL